MKFLFFLAVALLAAGCGGHATKPVEAAAAAPAAVETLKVEASEWPVTIGAPGTVKARTTATISARLMGYIREIRVRPGDRVAAGQLLVILDSREIDTSVQQAKAVETEAQSAVAEADNGIAAAQSQLVLAQATFKRMERLHQQTSISDQEFDEAQARLNAAQAGVAMAQSKRKQLDAKIAQTRQASESAAVMRGYTQISAPFAGVVTERPGEPGQLATPGAPLLAIEQAGAFRLEAPVEESLLGSLHAGDKVSVVFESQTEPMAARIDEIVPAVDPQSRAFVVKAALPANPALRSGVFGRLMVNRGIRRALLVPADAVTQRGEIQSVMVADGGFARMRLVTVGARHEGKAEILSGLSEGDRIIRGKAVADGAKVEVR